MPITTRSSIQTRSGPLVDRHEELESAIEAIRVDGVRLLTITGTAGVGKTRFAAELAERLASDHPERAVLIDLTTIDDPASLDLELARHLGMHTHDRARLSDDIDDWMSSHTALLVLDNAEHVLQIGDRLVQWLALSPDARAIVTSRHRLNVSIETELFLDTLATANHPERAGPGALSPAARMFLDIAGAADPTILAVETLVAVERLCARLEGLPLAIELVAARVPALTPAELNRLLDCESPFPLHPDTEVGAALEHAFDWSYWLLSPDAQQLLRYLTVFVDGFTLELAEFQATLALKLDLQVPVADCLHELDAHHLILPADRPHPGSPVFRMPAMVNDAARKRLITAGEETDAREAHAEAMVRFARQREHSGIRPGLEHEVAELDANFHNFTTALAWYRDRDNGDGLLALVASLWWFWYAHGFYGTGIGWSEEVQRRNVSRTGPIWGQFLSAFGVLLDINGEFDRASEVMDEAWRVHEASDNPLGLAMTSVGQGIIAFHQERYTDADQWLQQAIGLAGRIPQPDMARTAEGIAWANLGANAHERGNLDDAEHALRQAIGIQSQSGFRWGLARAWCDLGSLLRDRQDYQGALDAFHAALKPAQALGDQRVLAATFAGIATILTEDHQPLLAAWLWGAVNALRPAAGAPSFLRINIIAYERSRMLARRRLGPQGFSNATERGAAIPLDDVITRARESALRGTQAVHIPASIDATLTNRERDVLDLLAQGTSTEGMASTLGITERTVSSHIGSLLRKFNVTSRLELISATMSTS